ncbi:helix-turn-helix domain-containing protein [Amycolatopsis acidiphila]|uniref:Helix-turn-helix transcriptional regulator n=1 Tax=Amycolatopsis acidiphila TaxID=715473 RepID=A0A558AN39_9PSEU|nr:helix-turn-helix transcriptional regulator [Amycolatopsis acidiphila]TVT25684.1 helix-turn-helix transcriptional regulator [Amycolatopsis acidiphila]UIJ60441.1 helix-turn-helix domain-containing protein [Amycolatopsis acidiphila]
MLTRENAAGSRVRSSDSMPIGRLIRSVRREHGLTQYGLAEALATVSENDSLSRDEVARWERGKRVPGPYWQQWLSAVLEISPDRLRSSARLARELRWR